MQWTDAPNQPPCWANNQTFLSIAPFSSRICWDLDYFHTMVLRQILTRYDLTSRITSCVREIRESAGNAFREPFSKISRASTGWFPGVEPVCNPLPLATPNPHETFRETAFPHDCRFLFTTIASFSDCGLDREWVRE